MHRTDEARVRDTLESDALCDAAIMLGRGLVDESEKSTRESSCDSTAGRTGIYVSSFSPVLFLLKSAPFVFGDAWRDRDRSRPVDRLFVRSFV